MKYTVKVSRPLDEELDQALMVPVGVADEDKINEIMPQLVETIAEGSRSMDEFMVELVGCPPEDSGAGFGWRDLIWYDLEWEFAAEMSKKLRDLPGAQIIVSMQAMRPPSN